MIKYALIASMALAYTNETKFHYGDKVRITHGFYKGCRGIIAEFHDDNGKHMVLENHYEIMDGRCRHIEAPHINNVDERDLERVK